MELGKCARCGSFITSNSTYCTTCASKITYEKTLLKNYFEDVINFDSVHSVAEETGISQSTVEKYLAENSFPELNINNIDNSFNKIPY